MLICTLASGSSGNSMLISHGATHILIDAGISAKRITRSLAELGLAPDALSAVVVTHEHGDHISGLPVLNKHYKIPIWSSPGTALQLYCRLPRPDEVLRTVSAGDDFSVGALSLRSFSTPHDAAESVGYIITDGVRQVAVATDLGHVTNEVRAAVCGCDALVVESNHDVRMLQTGPYPYPLKRRILGGTGHLRNEDAAALVRDAVQSGARLVILAHLSLENNTPDLAFSASARALAECGADASLMVAPRSTLGEPIMV